MSDVAETFPLRTFSERHHMTSLHRPNPTFLNRSLNATIASCLRTKDVPLVTFSPGRFLHVLFRWTCRATLNRHILL